MRISDWCSDGCSSDLLTRIRQKVCAAKEDRSPIALFHDNGDKARCRRDDTFRRIVDPGHFLIEPPRNLEPYAIGSGAENFIFVAEVIVEGAVGKTGGGQNGRTSGRESVGTSVK